MKGEKGAKIGLIAAYMQRRKFSKSRNPFQFAGELIFLDLLVKSRFGNAEHLGSAGDLAVLAAKLRQDDGPFDIVDLLRQTQSRRGAVVQAQPLVQHAEHESIGQVA